MPDGEAFADESTPAIWRIPRTPFRIVGITDGARERDTVPCGLKLPNQTVDKIANKDIYYDYDYAKSCAYSGASYPDRCQCQLYQYDGRATGWYQALKRVAQLQRKTTNCREDFLHKLSTDLIQRFDVIAREDLNAKGLCRALRLGKSMADAALGELVRQLEYKAQWYG